MGRSKRYYAEYLVIFTLLFIGMFYFCYAEWFYKAGKTFFRSFDGLDQHYLIFLYIGNLIREFFYNLFHNHEIVIPLWNMGIGYGSDIPTSLGAYLPDPFNWISAFFPGVRSQFGYCLMIVAKVYAAGLAFSYFCFHKGAGRFATLAGSLMYMFSGTVYIVFIESFFVNPMYIFPLVLAGTDILWEKGKSPLYVFSLAFAFINYFYFAYMMCIFIFLYVLLKFAFLEKLKRTAKFFAGQVWRFLINSVFGLGISMIVILPIVLVLGNAGRLGVHYHLPLLFDKTYYIGLFTGFSNSYSMLGRDCIFGFGSIGLIAVLAFFANSVREYRKLKIIFLFLTIMLCIPLAGSIMNGFSYTANRWVWAYTFCVSYIFVVVFPLFVRLTWKVKLRIAISSIIYAGLIFALNYHSASLRNTMISIAVVTVAILLLNYIPNKFQRAFLLGLTCASLFVPALNHFRSGRGYDNALHYEVPRGTAYKSVKGNQLEPIMTELVENGFENRYDSWNVWATRNMSWLYGISGMDLYISIYNNNIDRFHNDLALMTGSAPMDYHGLNRRSDLEWLMNVQNFITKEESKAGLPWGYTNQLSKVSHGKEAYAAYGVNRENSLIHGFSTVIGMNAFNRLTPYDRQQALMKTIFTDEIPSTESGMSKLNLPENCINFGVETSNNLSYKDGVVKTSGKNGKIHLKFNKVSDSELYLYVEGVAEDGFNNEVSNYFYAEALNQGRKIPSTYTGRLTATYRTHMYGGKHKWLINLGVVKAADEIIINYPNKVESTLRKISVYAKPLSEIEFNIDSLNNLTNQVHFYNNGFSFKLENDKLPYMLVSVPYSKGWTAYVDGQKRDIHLADDAFMALPVYEGDREFRFTYMTPGLLPGLGISMISLIAYVLLFKRRIL